MNRTARPCPSRRDAACGALAALAVSLTVLSATHAGARVEPGDTVTRHNAEKIDGLVSPGIRWAVDHGMDLKIVPYRRIYAPLAYQEATEQYSDQASLDEHNVLHDWVAGLPFPVVDPNDPQIAPKIMYNYERKFQWTDDLNLANVDGETGAIYLNEDGSSRYRIERHFIAEWSRVLNYEGRVYHEPKPAIPDNEAGILRKFGFYPLIEPFDIKGVGSINYRYIDRHRFDDTWFYIPVIRRVRRISAAQRSDALFGQDIDVDSFGGYAGQIPWFDWKYLGERPMLASYHGENLPGKLCPDNGGTTVCEAWEMRPTMYVIEGRSKLSSYAYSKRMIYVDKESFTIPYTDMYDQAGELWKVLHYNHRYSVRPNPNVDYEYDEPQLFPYALSIIDMQLLHATRFSLPGAEFPDDPGWYVNVGPDSEHAVDESWYDVASLISSGR